jgi:hypothetical protein
MVDVGRSMSEKINEPIKVVARFEKGRLLPLSFLWKNQCYKVDQIDLVHFSWQGSARIYFFSTRGGGAKYQLVFNSQTFGWRLAQLEA